MLLDIDHVKLHRLVELIDAAASNSLAWYEMEKPGLYYYYYKTSITKANKIQSNLIK